MAKYDFRGVLGSTPNDFKANVKKTLEGLEEQEMRAKNISMRVMLIAALVALLAGTALALTRNVSVLDMREGALPEAQEAVVEISEDNSFESPLVRYRPIDTMADNGRILLAVEMTPLDPEKYAITSTWGGEQAFLKAKEQGKALICADVDVKINGEHTPSWSGGGEIIQDNSRIVNFELDPDNVESVDSLTVTLSGIDYELLDPGVQHWDEADQHLDTPEVTGEKYETEKSFDVSLKDLERDVRRFEGPFDLEYVTIDWVEFSRTAASLGMTLQYTHHEDLSEELLDELAFMSIRLVDPTGVKNVRTFEFDASSYIAYPVGLDKNNNWVYDESAIVEGSFIEETLWPAVPEWPEKLELVAYYKGLGEWSKTVTLWMKDGD